MKYNRRDPVECQAIGNSKQAWFYVNEGSIVVITDVGGQAVVTRRQLQAALTAMRKPRSK